MRIPSSLIDAAISDRLAPVCGAGFSLNARSPHRPPFWAAMADAATKSRTGALRPALKRSPSTMDDVKFLVETCHDSLSALSLLELAAPGARSRSIETIRGAAKGTSSGALPVHQTFWAADWPIVFTTNYDDYLEIACGHVAVLDYSRPELTRQTEEEARRDDLNAVIHLHGILGSKKAPPLVTWSDYISGYDWRSLGQLEAVREFILDTSGLAGADLGRYRSILGPLLDSSRTHAADAFPGRVVQLIDQLLANKSCLFLGFSLSDPIWRLLLRRLVDQGAASGHYMVMKGSRPAWLDPVVEAVQLSDFAEMDPFLADLSCAVRRAKAPVESGERRARIDNYDRLKRQYPAFDTGLGSGWIAVGKDAKGRRSIVPFVEVWINDRGLAPDLAVRAGVDTPGEYVCKPALKAARAAIWSFRRKQQARRRDGGTLTNERKIRVGGARLASDGGLELRVQLAEYKDFLFTNHLVANVDQREVAEMERRGVPAHDVKRIMQAFTNSAGEFDPRGALCGDESAIALRSDAACSNHLGVSLLVIAELPDGAGRSPALLCPPTRGQVSSPNDLVMTASGSADWPLRSDARSLEDVVPVDEVRANPGLLRLDEQIWREFAEECLHDRRLEARIRGASLGSVWQERLKRGSEERRRFIRASALMALCQNVDRGGKPELFYVASVNMPGEDFVGRTLQFNWELMPVHSLEVTESVERALLLRRMMCLRSPLDLDLNPVADPMLAFEQIVAIVVDTRFNSVLRAHLASLLRYCLARHAAWARAGLDRFKRAGLRIAGLS